PSLVRHFQEHPPEGFVPIAVEGGVPAFSMRFDLLTTLEPSVLRRLERLPLARWWRRLLRPLTCFVGTTVSEYVLLPVDQEPERLAGELLERLAPRYPFLIIKDLPTEGVLVGEEALAYSRRLFETCRRMGFVLLEGQALAYVAVDFASTEEYLSRLSHARRKNVRRKLRSRGSLEVERIATGDLRFDDEALLEALYALYGNVYAQSEIHFDRLTLPFFRAVLQDADVHGIVFLYRAGAMVIGFNLCLCENGMLIDKYVGFAYPEAREHDLYTVSWFHNLEYALEHGCRVYIAGWTDPEIKRQLGARFTFTSHAVFVRNPILRALLRPLRKLFESDRAWESACAKR
ncbi:MAG: synthase subunit alpha, partial [Acidobacteria bacterium]|nr:synthase subunit alpha [Acidobacteriota bacterium]